jgi:hypothetical protein
MLGILDDRLRLSQAVLGRPTVMLGFRMQQAGGAVTIVLIFVVASFSHRLWCVQLDRLPASRSFLCHLLLEHAQLLHHTKASLLFDNINLQFNFLSAWCRAATAMPSIAVVQLTVHVIGL